MRIAEDGLNALAQYDSDEEEREAGDADGVAEGDVLFEIIGSVDGVSDEVDPATLA